MRINRKDLSPAYGFLDPHGGQSDIKRVASRSALLIAQADAIGRVFVTHAWAGRCSTPMIMSKIEQAVERMAVKIMGVEANGLAGLWTDAMRVNAQLRMKRLPLKAVKQPPNQEKIFRIRTTLQPVISRGMLFLDMNDPGQIELQHEIVSFPMSVRMDMVDALASLVRHIIPPVTTRRESEIRQDAFLKYMRDSGASPRQMEAIMRERHGGRPIWSLPMRS